VLRAANVTVVVAAQFDVALDYLKKLANGELPPPQPPTRK
jgi:hypothetical protein